MNQSKSLIRNENSVQTLITRESKEMVENNIQTNTTDQKLRAETNFNHLNIKKHKQHVCYNQAMKVVIPEKLMIRLRWLKSMWKPLCDSGLRKCAD